MEVAVTIHNSKLKKYRMNREDHWRNC